MPSCSAGKPFCHSTDMATAPWHRESCHFRGSSSWMHGWHAHSEHLGTSRLACHSWSSKGTTQAKPNNCGQRHTWHVCLRDWRTACVHGVSCNLAAIHIAGGSCTSDVTLCAGRRKSDSWYASTTCACAASLASCPKAGRPGKQYQAMPHGQQDLGHAAGTESGLSWCRCRLQPTVHSHWHTTFC
jgi:hypothetical protein